VTVDDGRRALGLPAAASIAAADAPALREPFVGAQSHTRWLRVVKRDAASWRPRRPRGRRWATWAPAAAAVVGVPVVLIRSGSPATEQHRRERHDQDQQQ
jgi:type II secretory pathway component PulM